MADLFQARDRSKARGGLSFLEIILAQQSDPCHESAIPAVMHTSYCGDSKSQSADISRLAARVLRDGFGTISTSDASLRCVKVVSYMHEVGGCHEFSTCCA